MNDQISDQIGMKLQQALDNRTGELDIKKAIVQAGLSGDKRYRPLLKSIAEKTAKEGKRKVTYDALLSLWQLGESQQYFFSNAQASDSNKWLAYFSILILGQNLNDETQTRLNEIKENTTDNQIRGSIAEVERLQALATDYEKFKTDQEKINFVLSFFRGDWNPITFGTQLGSSTDPLAIWTQQKLFQLSKEMPELVAQIVSQVDLSDKYEDPVISKSYRDYIAEFLSVESALLLQKFEEKG